MGNETEISFYVDEIQYKVFKEVRKNVKPKNLKMLTSQWVTDFVENNVKYETPGSKNKFLKLEIPLYQYKALEKYAKTMKSGKCSIARLYRMIVFQYMIHEVGMISIMNTEKMEGKNEIVEKIDRLIKSDEGMYVKDGGRLAKRKMYVRLNKFYYHLYNSMKKVNVSGEIKRMKKEAVDLFIVCPEAYNIEMRNHKITTVLPSDDYVDLQMYAIRSQNKVQVSKVYKIILMFNLFEVFLGINMISLFK